MFGKSYYRSKVILLTGAASGYGLEMARILATIDCRLILLDINEEALMGLREEFTKATAETLFYVCDVREEAQLLEIKTNLPAAFKAVDILIANAGISNVFNVQELSTEDCRRSIDINYLGTVYTVECFLPDMLERGSGHVVGVSSLAGLKGLPEGAYYCASKAAQATYLETLRLETRKYGVNVSVVFPGFMRTPMNQGLIENYFLAFLMLPEKAAKRTLTAIAARRRHIYFPFTMASLTLLARIGPAFIFDFFMPKFHWLVKYSEAQKVRRLNRLAWFENRRIRKEMKKASQPFHPPFDLGA